MDARGGGPGKIRTGEELSRALAALPARPPPPPRDELAAGAEAFPAAEGGMPTAFTA